MKERPTRKPNRLHGYDYSQNGAYFVTVCTKNRVEYFWEPNVGAIIDRPPWDAILSREGRIVRQSIQMLKTQYPFLLLENYVIMPNHIHLLLLFQYPDSGRSVSAPTDLSTVVRHMKGYATREIGFNLWQKSFHDHVIRSEKDHKMIFDYIEQNPENWKQDCFFQN